MMDPNVDDELIEILENESLSKETRSQGWEYVLGLSAADDGLNYIIYSKKYIPFILSYILDENEECIKQAYECLINIATQEHGAYSILACRTDFCDYLLLTVCSKTQKLALSKCCLLANLSRYDEIAKKIISIFFQSSKDMLQKLVEIYCSCEPKVRRQYDYLTIVFANISRLTAGRRFLLEDTNFLTSILPFTRASESDSRRLGTAFILRNCCFETEFHDKLLKDVDILPAVLLPLMVPEEYEEGGEMGKLPPEIQRRCLEEVKERDPSVPVRRVLVQALIMLCYSENGWNYLRLNGVYYVVRELHLWEDDDVTKDIIEDLVSYFLVKNYTKIQANASFSNEDCDLIKELESEMTKDLPDFVINKAH